MRFRGGSMNATHSGHPCRGGWSLRVEGAPVSPRLDCVPSPDVAHPTRHACFRCQLLAAGPATMTHLVEVFTSDLEGAGSGAEMIISFEGALGGAGPYELANDDGRRFLQNAHSQYHLDLPDLGALDKAIIQQQQIERGPEGLVGPWHLGWISVTNLATHVTTLFPCDRQVPTPL